VPRIVLAAALMLTAGVPESAISRIHDEQEAIDASAEDGTRITACC
jgi:hypothetical protein